MRKSASTTSNHGPTPRAQMRPNGSPAVRSEYKIVVAGDVFAEMKLAMSQVRQNEQHTTVYDTSRYMKPYAQCVGAASISEIIRRLLAGLPAVSPKQERPVLLSRDSSYWEQEFAIDERYREAYVVCEQVPKRPNSNGEVTWRIKQRIGFDRKVIAPEKELVDLSPDDKDGDADLVIVNQSVGADQAMHGFMGHKNVWPPSFVKPKKGAWLLVEWSRPHLQPPFNKELQDAVKLFEGRVIIVVTAEDLRLGGARISRGISWERTLTDLFVKVRELWICDPKLPKEEQNPLCGCSQLVVSFGTSGAAIFSRPEGKLRGQLIYDPRYLEDTWGEQFEGEMSGYTRSITTGVALEMIYAGRSFTELEGKGVKAGIIAARRVLETGFVGIGRVEGYDTELPNKLRFPASVAARVLRSAVAEDDIVATVEKVAAHVDAALSKRVAFDAAEDLPEFVARAVKAATLDDQQPEPKLDFPDAALERDVARVAKDWTDFDDPVKARRDKAELEHCRKVAALKRETGEALTKAERKRTDEILERQHKRWRRLVDRILGFIRPDREAIAEVKALQEVSIDESTPLADWSILEQNFPDVADERDDAGGILEECRKIVEYGDSNDLRFPTMRVGKLLVTSRDEMESVTAVRELMESYVGGKMPTPLSIGVFGPPGSGKSFAIKELAANIPTGRYSEIKSLTFNVSQFNGPEALAIAMQQVRDEGLKGKMPLVFWDEFDTQFAGGMGWLRYFLAPMQDGVYQDGSAVYYIGRAIFVFAGGTHRTMEQFIDKAKVAGKVDDYTPEAIAAKQPDFISRLKGFVNVEPLDYETTKSGGAERIMIDAATALRRAKVLRSVLERSDAKLVEVIPHEEGPLGPTLRRRLNVDPGVLGAFLRIKEFRYGARSVEAIVNMSALTRKNRYDRSSLPPDDQLDLHVDAKAFMELVEEKWPCLASNGAASPSDRSLRRGGAATAGASR
jgi:hypothetical protein